MAPRRQNDWILDDQTRSQIIQGDYNLEDAILIRDVRSFDVHNPMARSFAQLSAGPYTLRNEVCHRCSRSAKELGKLSFMPCVTATGPHMRTPKKHKSALKKHKEDLKNGRLGIAVFDTPCLCCVATNCACEKIRGHRPTSERLGQRLMSAWITFTEERTRLAGNVVALRKLTSEFESYCDDFKEKVAASYTEQRDVLFGDPQASTQSAFASSTNSTPSQPLPNSMSTGTLARTEQLDLAQPQSTGQNFNSTNPVVDSTVSENDPTDSSESRIAYLEGSLNISQRKASKWKRKVLGLRSRVIQSNNEVVQSRNEAAQLRDDLVRSQDAGAQLETESNQLREELAQSKVEVARLKDEAQQAAATMKDEVNKAVREALLRMANTISPNI